MVSIAPRTTAAALIALGLLGSSNALANDTSTTARTLVAKFVEAVIAGPDAVAPLLAPEYQIMRSNGVGYDRDGYIKRGAGSVNARPAYSFDDMVVTAGDDVMVVRYFLQIEETIDNKVVTRRAPRLTVFRKIADNWKISAHANFAQVD